MANLFVAIVILGCAAYQYLKGTLVKAFTTIIIVLCAIMVGFGYFEALARLLIKYSPSLATWAQSLCFILLFVLSFAVLQTIAAQLNRQKVNLGLMPERIGRVVCGIILGLLTSGILLVAADIAPLPNKYPYQRFDQRNPDAEKPSKVLLNTDGFVTGWFNIISSGSLSGKKSFAALHPRFLDQIYLNRHTISDDITIMTSSEAIEVPNKNAAWFAPENIKDSEGKPLPLKAGYNLVIVRVGISKKAIRDAGKFTLSQLRLICKPTDYAKDPLTGKGDSVYPIGYIKAAGQLQQKKLNDKITIPSDSFNDRVKWIDFAFYLPSDMIPTLVGFKLNNIAAVTAPVSADQAPAPVFFSESLGDQSRTQAPRPQQPSEQAESSAPQEEDATPSETERRSGLSDLSRSVVGGQLDEGE
jgi:hypothetical protein